MELNNLLSREAVKLIEQQPEEYRSTWFAFYMWLKVMPSPQRKEVISRVKLINMAVKLNPELREEAFNIMCKEYPLLKNLPIE